MIAQDEIIYCVQHGLDLVFVLGLDFVSLASACKSVERNEARTTLISSRLAWLSAQSTVEGLEKYLEPFKKLIGSPAPDQSAFIKDVGSGF